MSVQQQKILVVDDDPKIRRLLRHCFEPEGFGVLEAENSAEINLYLSEETVDLITLDLNLGPENGLTIASALKVNHDIPIIIVTGKSDVIDRVVGLEMGADDYISKPFHVREVIARVRTVLRRAKESAPTAHTLSADAKPNDDIRPQGRHRFNDWLANFDTFELTSVGGEPCELTTADFKLLKIFLENPKRVLSREQIMDQLNGHDWIPYDRTIDNQVARLRKKLEENLNKPQLIKTVRGVGYTFATEVTRVQD